MYRLRECTSCRAPVPRTPLSSPGSPEQKAALRRLGLRIRQVREAMGLALDRASSAAGIYLLPRHSACGLIGPGSHRPFVRRRFAEPLANLLSSKARRPIRRVLSCFPMHALKAQVRNGRLVLDEPTNLPEGEVVYLQPIDAAGVDDDLDDQERAALHQALDEGIAAARAGDHGDAEEFEQELLARK